MSPVDAFGKSARQRRIPCGGAWTRPTTREHRTEVRPERTNMEGEDSMTEERANYNIDNPKPKRI